MPNVVRNRWKRYRRWWILSAALLALAVPVFQSTSQHGVTLTVFDVGQGDGVLIRGQDQFDIVIDGGPTDRFVRQLASQLPAGDRTIELMILTHPHADHITGLLGVLEKYRVERVLTTAAENPSWTFHLWQQLIQSEGALVERPTTGQVYTFPGGQLTVFWPVSDAVAQSSDLNDSSIVLRLDVGDRCAWLMGDATAVVEHQILTSISHCAILKVGHHGSAYSSSDEFLAAAHPDTAIISVGQGNRYGHPAPSTLQRLSHVAQQILRTDLDGSIQVVFPEGAQPLKIRHLDKF